MLETTNKLEALLAQLSAFVADSSEEGLLDKPSDEKWSKKEILGHLIDSGLYNLQRFTEIQFEEKPFKIISYKQNELIKANAYQDSNTNDILNLLLAINNRIITLIKAQTEETLSYKIIVEKDGVFDLKFLMEDYVNHFEHHSKQIVE